MSNQITNSDNIIDSRNIIARIEELESELSEVLEGYEDAEDCLENCDSEACQDAESELEELKTLKAFAEEAKGYAPDWRYGATLINEDYFVEYCKDLLSDIGDLPRDIPNYIEIDWEATAENIKADYTKVDFDGQTYLVR